MPAVRMRNGNGVVKYQPELVNGEREYRFDLGVPFWETPQNAHSESKPVLFADEREAEQHAAHEDYRRREETWTEF